ncbi:MAG: RnfABCDGE type electron transport complex subunit G [Nanobdellota archaeon]
MNEVIRTGLVLMIVTIIAAGALGLTKDITSEKIEERQKDKLDRSLERVMNADDFEKKGDHYEAYLDDEPIGKVVRVKSQGYSSEIELIVGIDKDNKVTGVDVLNQEETPGLGTKIENRTFLKQFENKMGKNIKLREEGGSIDAVTGATISSSAVTEGVREALNGTEE